MGKTKTQAQKREERKTKLKEAEEKQKQEKLSRALAYQNRGKQELYKPSEPAILSKKALRKQKNQESGLKDEVEVKQHFSLESELSDNKNNTKHVMKELMHATEEKAKEASEKEVQSLSTERQPAKTVQNHSSYCEGLKPVLARLAKNLPACTLMPGELSRKNKSGEYPHLDIRFQRMANENNYKFVVRRGHNAQNLIIKVPDANTYNLEFLEECIKEAIENPKKLQDSDVIDDSDDISMSSYNHIVAKNRERAWENEHQKKHEALKQQEQRKAKEKKIKQQSRVLANKNIPAAERKQYAERDVDILSGQTRGKYSMN